MDTVLLYILGVLIMVVGIALSIGLHEVGHLVPAKFFNVRVGQYMIGFGRTIWSTKRGETEYGLKMIPLGGYISMAGMYPPAKGETASRESSTGFLETLMQDARTQSADQIEPGHEDRVFYKLAVWKRIIIMLGGPFMNLLIGIVLFTILLCGFGVAQPTTTISGVSECVLPSTSERQECEEGDPLAPAAAAGIKPGDTFVNVAGEKVESWDEATAIIRESAGTEIDIVVERDGSELTVQATPILTERYRQDQTTGQPVQDANGDPIVEEVGFMGIGSVFANVQQPVTEVLPVVGDRIVRVGGIILNLPQRLVDVAEAAFGTEARDPNGPVSVVGVGRLAGEITSLTELPVATRVQGLLEVLAGLNIALFVFNLVPLLPLDGGHVAGALFEGIRRFFAKLFKRPDPGPLDIAKFVPVTLVVVFVLGAMSVLLIYADIVKPISIL